MSNMKIPKEIKVGGHTYKIILANTNDQKKDRDNWGMCYHSQKEIYIDSAMAKSQQEETLIHELLHCIDEVYNAHKLGEETVQRISQGLYQVLKDNQLLKTT